jgi:hypothetical protein
MASSVTDHDPSSVVQKHVRARLLELGVKVAATRRAYLDKCFWVRLRDHANGIKSTAATSALFDALRSEVRQGGLICPISDTLFVELLRQSDLRTRSATAELIDEFSTGVSLIPDEERFNLEVETLVLRRLGQSVQPIEHRVWSRVAFVLGIPHTHPHPGRTADAVEIGFFDYLWDLPLVRVLAVIGDRVPPDPMFGQQAKLLNEGNAEQSTELRSFQQAYRDELAGALDLAIPQMQRTLETVYRSTGSNEPANWTDDHLRKMHAVLVAVARTPEGRMALRSAHLAASMHAATRWSKTKRLTAHDLPDFLHAGAAIGYCDAFFTDGPTKHLLDQKNLGIHDDFSCATAADDALALKWLRSDSLQLGQGDRSDNDQDR